MNKKGVNVGLFITGISLALIIGLLSVYNYIIGIYSITIIGFLIFSLGRLVYLDIPWGTGLEILIFITTISMLISQKLKNSQINIFFKNTFFILFTIYLFYAVISVINPAMYSKMGWISECKRLFALYCFFLLIYIGIDNIRDYYRYSRFLIILFVIAAIYGCVQEIFGFAEFEINYIMRSENRRNLYFLISGIKRKFSLHSDPSSFGISMAAVSCILLNIIINNRFTKKTIFNIALLILTLLAMVFSGTRTAYLSFIASTCFLLILTINKTATRVIGAFLILGFAFMMIVPIYSNPTLNRFRSAFDFTNEESLNVRDMNRKSVQPYMLKNPFGGGLGTTSGSGKKYNPNHYLAGFETDSGYLKISTELGWIALILVLMIYYIILKEGLNIYFKSENNITKLLISCCLVCIFSFVVAQYAQVAVGQFPDSYLFYSATAIICKISINYRKI